MVSASIIHQFPKTCNDVRSQHFSINVLPSDVLKIIFGYFTFNQNLQLALVSRSWRVLTQTLPDWVKKGNILGCEPSRSSIVEGIKEIMAEDFKATPALASIVKTAKEFDEAMHLLYSLDFDECIKVSHDPEYQRKDYSEVFSNVTLELNQKKILNQTIETGLAAAVKLFLLKRVPFTRLEQYAKVLKETYGDDQVWMKITHQLLSGGGTEAAKNVFFTKLRGTYQTESLLIKFIKPLCDEGKFAEALTFFVENYKPNPFLIDSMPRPTKEAMTAILTSATEAKQFAVAEDALERIVPPCHKPEEIRNLMKVYFQSDLGEKLEALYLKYSDFLKFLPVSSFNVTSLIEIHLLGGDVERAWKITMDFRERDRFVTSTLLFFLQHYVPHHQQKIAELRKLLKEDLAKDELPY